MEPPRRKWSWFEWACAALMLGGVLSRLGTFTYQTSAFDSAEMVQMGSSFLRYHEFVMPYATGWEYSHHFPPLFPLYVAMFLLVFGTHFWVVQLAVIAGSAAFVAIVFFCTRDLYGRERAFATAAIAAVFPLLVTQDQVLYSESIVAALFALTIWGILKSLEKPQFIVFAGLFAALSYLVKASMGPFFLLAGAGGFAWRFYYVRWGIFRDKWYLLAGAIFGSIIVAWSARNLARFGWPHYETQQHATDAFGAMFASPTWPFALLGQTIWMTVIVLLFLLPWLPQARRSLKHVRDQKVSALWMAVVTPALVAIFFVTAFFISENYKTVANETALRYITAPIVPMLWIAFREEDFSAQPKITGSRKLPRTHAALFWGAVGLLSLTLALDPTHIYLSGARVILVYAAIAVAALLLAVSTGFLYVRQGRDVRASHDPAAGRTLAIGLLMVAICIAATLFFWFHITLFLLPAVAAAFVRDVRFKVVALAVLFLAGGLGGSTQQVPLEDLAKAVNDATPPGGTLASWHLTQRLAWFEPWLRPDIKLLPENSTAQTYVAFYGMPTDPDTPDGYHVAAHLKAPIAMGPGTWLENHLEPLIGESDTPPSGDVYVYAQNATVP